MHKYTATEFDSTLYVCVCVCAHLCTFPSACISSPSPAYPPFFSSCPNLLLNKKIIKDMELVYYCDVLWFTPQLEIK